MADIAFDPAKFSLHLSVARAEHGVPAGGLDLDFSNIVFDEAKHPRLHGKFAKAFGAADAHGFTHGGVESVRPGKTDRHAFADLDHDWAKPNGSAFIHGHKDAYGGATLEHDNKTGMTTVRLQKQTGDAIANVSHADPAEAVKLAAARRDKYMANFDKKHPGEGPARANPDDAQFAKKIGDVVTAVHGQSYKKGTITERKNGVGAHQIFANKNRGDALRTLGRYHPHGRDAQARKK